MRVNYELSVKIICIILMLCISLLLVQSTFIDTCYAESDSFKNTNVLDDLRSAKINGESFDIKNYPFYEQGNLKIIQVVEYCYSYKKNKQANYGLYFYVYNPQGLVLSETSGQNKVQIAVGDEVNYTKYALEFCSKSNEAAYRGLFYKYRLKDADKILEKLNSNERTYKISGIELLRVGNKNATEYTVGGKYNFTGYSKGYGPNENDESSLTCRIEEIETLLLNVQHTAFRTNMSSQGAGHYNQVNTVYFSIPNYIYKQYGYLQKIKAEWWEYKTKKALITSNESLYNAFMPYTKINVGEHSDAVNGNLYINRVDQNTSTMFQSNSKTSYDWAYNIKGETQSGFGYLRIIEVKSASDQIPYCFYSPNVSGVDDVFSFFTESQNVGDVTSNEVLDYIYNFQGSGETIDCNGRDISADLFEATVDGGRTRGYNLKKIDLNDTFDLLSYDSNHEWYDKLLDFGFSWPDTSGDYSNVSPIYEVSADDVIGTKANISKNLLVDEDDVSDIQAAYAQAQLKGEHLVLFRFAATDYFTQNVDGTINGIEVKSNNKDTYVAQETCFFDFDIIELTFNKEGEYFVIPVVSSPIDIVSGFTAPADEISIWKLILGIILGILLILILLPILPYIIRAVLWVITLPFKIVIAIFKSIRKRKRGGKENGEIYTSK